MSDTFYFTGTRSQFIELSDKFNKQAEFREGEITFKITVTELGAGSASSEETDELEMSEPPLAPEPVEPAKK